MLPETYPPEQGYRIVRADYELPDPGLAPDELAALRLALQAVRVGEQSGATWKFAYRTPAAAIVSMFGVAIS